MRNPMRALVLLLLTATLAACGFQLRGAQTLPFQKIYLSVPATSELGANLRRTLRANGTAQITEDPKEADVGFLPTAENRDKLILSLNAAGRVREYQLRLRYAYRLVDQNLQDVTPPAELVLTRDVTYDDAQVLAKDQEEALLWRDMQNDLVQQIMRRLAAAKPAAATAKAAQ